MARVYVFSDESGNFDFSRSRGATRYFGLGTVALRDGEPRVLRADLLQLRMDLAWRQLGLDSAFHATTDAQAVRDEVFRVLARHPLRIDVTILEKSKAKEHLRVDEPTFLRYAWYYHFKYVVDRVCQIGDELMIVAAEIGTKKRRAAFRNALEDVIRQTAWHVPHRVAFWPDVSDPCLQAADYCLWAVMRAWERSDDRSRVLIKHRLKSEFDLFAAGSTHYY